jgi:hypothetical protein
MNRMQGVCRGALGVGFEDALSKQYSRNGRE